ncbi:MAG: hypothetical protein JNL57_11215 [Bacteroidetes bacterium]|nr:hypothetical protein [Bacteroidota bacterium]
MPFSRRNVKNSGAALLVIIAGLALLLAVWFRAEWPAGGQDSWNHYLFARWAVDHPILLMDQWGKTLFTLPAIPFARFGISGIYVFNILCALATAWICYLCARRLGMQRPWLAAALFLFQPIVFANTISGLTEPITALVLVVVCYLFASNRYLAAAILASFLPYFRSEGFVLLAAVLVYLAARRKWKWLPWLLTGTLAFAILGFAVFREWDWIIKANPYIAAGMNNDLPTYTDSFFHYAQNQRRITGPVVSGLLLLALCILAVHAVHWLKRKTPEEKSLYSFWLLAPLFVSFFLAHSYLIWKGSLGTHGILRVFYAVAPAAALLAQYALHKIFSIDIKNLNRVLVAGVLVVLMLTLYPGAAMPYPWKKEASIPGFPGEANVGKAVQFIREQGLQHHTLLHQLPYLNEKLDLDPWGGEKAGTYYIWSLDTRPGKDWLPDSSVMIWDNFHARRDAPMPLEKLRTLSEYHELKYFPSEADSIYDVRVFLKVKAKE